MSKAVLLDLVIMNKEGLVGDVKVESSLDCSVRETLYLGIIEGRSRAISKIATLDFRRVDFDLFRDLLGGIPRLRTLEDRGT